jgi:hypothetical protein
MKGWITAFLALGACQDVQPQPVTEQVQQDLGDCTPGNNFPGRTLAPTPYFNGQAPLATTTQVWIMYRNPGNPTETVAYLTDFVTGQSVYGTRVSNQDPALALWLYGHGQPQVLEPVLPPPPPPRCPGCDPNPYYASYNAEYALRWSTLSKFAAAAVKWPP